MIKIHKQPPPKELVDLKAEAANRHLSPDDAYRLLVNPLKNSVMQQLMVEQGHLCAYCMRQLPDDRTMPETVAKVSIEHWYPRNPPNGNDVGQGLDYQNMLAVCSGNRGDRHEHRRRSALTCDARRKDGGILTVNPLDENTLTTIYYTSDGEIGATDKTIHDDLTIQLNLNCRKETVKLPEERKSVLDNLQNTVYEIPETERLEFCRFLLQRYEEEMDPKTPYVGIILWWLKDFLNTQQKASLSSH